MTKPENKGKAIVSQSHGYIGPVIMLIIALICLAVGYSNGDPASYFQKAFMVCTECIGIG
jgi:hypothetical protein